MKSESYSIINLSPLNNTPYTIIDIIKFLDQNYSKRLYDFFPFNNQV